MKGLYGAIIALGRSISEIDLHGWTLGTFGNEHHKKCAVGLLSYSFVQTPDHLSLCGLTDDETEAAILAAYALYDVLSPEQVERLEAALRRLDEDNNDSHFDRVYASFRDRNNASLTEIEDITIITNDQVMTEQAEARRWFSDALDLLAEQLPIPAEAVVPEHEGRPVTFV
jgi:hypothetical protein